MPEAFARWSLVLPRRTGISSRHALRFRATAVWYRITRVELTRWFRFPYRQVRHRCAIGAEADVAPTTRVQPQPVAASCSSSVMCLCHRPVLAAHAAPGRLRHARSRVRIANGASWV